MSFLCFMYLYIHTQGKKNWGWQCCLPLLRTVRMKWSESVSNGNKETQIPLLLWSHYFGFLKIETPQYRAARWSPLHNQQEKTQHQKVVCEETCEIIFTSCTEVAQRQTLLLTLHFTFYIYKALWKCIIPFTVLLSVADLWCCIDPVLPLGYKSSEAWICIFWHSPAVVKTHCTGNNKDIIKKCAGLSLTLCSRLTQKYVF